ncbi:MAG: alpha/beta hydrolase [Candidatus Heimdallarchaeaceae archaeon]
MISETLSLAYRNEQIAGILFLPEGEQIFPLVIRLNGLPGNAPEKEKNRLAEDFIKNNIAYFAFDYTGARKSTGIFEYYSSQENISIVITELSRHPKIDPSRIGLFGESFGGAMAICHAVRDKRVRCLVLRSPVYDTEVISKLSVFDSLAHFWVNDKKLRFPNVNLKENFTLQTKHYNPKKLIHKINLPIRIITGTKDELLSPEKINKLYKNLPENIDKDIKLIEGAGHNFTNPLYLEELKDFIIPFFKKYLILKIN